MISSATVQRLWNKREKQGSGTLHAKGKSSSASTTGSESLSTIYYGLFSTTDKPADAQEEQKVKILRRCIGEAKSITLSDTQLIYALHSRYASGDIDKAYELMLALSDSWQGSLTGYRPAVRVLGAENRNAVTCYLDSILFAMFSRLDSFEPMLRNTFKDDARNRLGMMLRLWVNFLRSGKLITTEITQMLQEALAECGWEDAAALRQQDASEAFTFITEKLELPLLTLKMDIYHTGREDVADDHKFINERLLEVAIPATPQDPEQLIPLEDCLEAYFNNRIEVKRYLGLRSAPHCLQPGDASDSISEKGAAIHMELVNLDAVLLAEAPHQRSSSIVQQRFVPDEAGPRDPPAYEAQPKRLANRLRSGSTRKEVMMPAWQFFSLIPWYTDNTPKDDAQVAAHFSARRPILGICLKRYSFTEGGDAIRLETRIDIPTEIGLPHFISDDQMNEDGPIYGNFKLLLQSVVCHRGESVNSGHYVSLVRGDDASVVDGSACVENGASGSHQWMRFDDLAAERVVLVDINQALKEETPYLLFYQIVPIDTDSEQPSDGESLPLYEPIDSHDSGVGGMFSEGRGSNDERISDTKLGLENCAGDYSPRGRSPTREQGRQSTSVDETASLGEPVALDPRSSQPASRCASPSGRRHSSHRSHSQTSEMFSKSFSRLTRKKSKESAPQLGNAAGANDPVEDGHEAPTIVLTEDDKGKSFFRKDRRGEKSKSWVAKGKASGISGKIRSEKPDRECCVM